MFIENEYSIGDIVYLKTDSEQLERMVFAIEVSSTGLLYRLSCGIGNTYHYGIEMSTEKDITKSCFSRDG